MKIVESLSDGGEREKKRQFLPKIPRSVTSFIQQGSNAFFKALMEIDQRIPHSKPSQSKKNWQNCPTNQRDTSQTI